MILPHSHGCILAMLAIHSDDLGALHECNCVTVMCKHATSFYTGIIIIIIALCSGWHMIDLGPVKTVAQCILFTTIKVNNDGTAWVNGLILI